MLTIYKASAGSGKTYTLAYEYIKALLGVKSEAGTYRLATPDKAGGHRHRHILAITFTNKATEEMKSRIVRELYLISVASPEAAYTARLVKELGCTSEALARSAAVALKQILFDFNFFNISTIDSFFQTVLRTFAREVDKPGNFEVELNDRYAVAMGASMMLSDLNTSHTPEATPVGKWIKQFMEDKLEEGEAFDIFNRKGSLHTAMVTFIRRIAHEDFKEHWAQVNDYLADPTRLDGFRKAMLRLMGANDASVRAAARELDGSVRALGIDPFEAFDSGRYARVLRWCDACPVSGDFETKGAQALLAGNTDKTVKAAWLKAHGPLPDAFTDKLVALYQKAFRWVTARKIYTRILNGIYYLGLLGHAMRYIDEYRRENNLILLSDTNQLLKTIIGGSETPFIYERLGVELQHFMIDEFQDTSRMQWDILYPLVLNSHSAGFDNLVIGDEKQSIYRFRSADPSLLGSRLATQFSPVAERGSVPEENTNYRSRPVIVGFNNALYTAMAGAHSIESYRNVVQRVPEGKADAGGYVRVEIGPAVAKAVRHDRVLPRVADAIIDMHSRGYRFSDIAVLVRTRAEAETVVQYLTTAAAGMINVMSDESLLLVSCASVRLVISVLRIIQDARRPSLPAEKDKSAYTTPDEVRLILNRMEYHLNAGADVAEAAGRVASDTDEIRDLARFIESLKSSTLLTLLEHVMARVLIPEVRERDKAYLSALRDYVVDYCSTHSGDLHSFLRWWDVSGQKLTISGSDNIDAVRVMTIHKSKGLQMECVICPFLDYAMFKPDEEAWYVPERAIPGIDQELIPPLLSIPGCRELADPDVSPVAEQYTANMRAQTVDTLNTTYVATTRAVSEMLLFTTMTSDPDSVGSWIADALPSLGVEAEADGDIMVYTFGEPVTSVSRDEKQAESISTVEPAPDDPVFREDTQDFTRIPDDSVPDYEDDPDAASSQEDTADKDELARGLVLHHVLSLVHRAPDLEHAFERVAHARRLPQDERQAYWEVLAHAFRGSESHPLLSGWFHTFTRCLTERSIYIPGTGSTYRPDRIVWLPDGRIQLIDYKFTRASHASHIKQVKSYCKILAKMGYTAVEAYLWYPLTGEILPVPQ